MKKRNEALVVLKGTEETFERRLRERSRQRKAFVREYIRIYNSTIISSRIQVKDERGGPETVGSDDQGKSPRLLCVVLFLNFFETSLVCLCLVSLQLPRERSARLISSSADLVFLPLVYLALVVLRYIRLRL